MRVARSRWLERLTGTQTAQLALKVSSGLSSGQSDLDKHGANFSHGDGAPGVPRGGSLDGLEPGRGPQGLPAGAELHGPRPVLQ